MIWGSFISLIYFISFVISFLYLQKQKTCVGEEVLKICKLIPVKLGSSIMYEKTTWVGSHMRDPRSMFDLETILIDKEDTFETERVIFFYIH